MVINAYCADAGWLFEDLKSHFTRFGAVATEAPLSDASGWICIRTSEAVDCPDISRCIVQVHDMYEHDVLLYQNCALVIFTHPMQHWLWRRRGFSGRYKILPIGTRSGIQSPAAGPQKPVLGFFCRETPRLEKGSDVFHDVVLAARKEVDFDVLMIGGNLEKISHLGTYVERAANEQDYMRIDALFSASISPAVPLSVYEACSIGIPVISTPRWFPDVNWPNTFIGMSTDSLTKHLVHVIENREFLFKNRNKSIHKPFLLDDWISCQAQSFFSKSGFPTV